MTQVPHFPNGHPTDNLTLRFIGADADPSARRRVLMTHEEGLRLAALPYDGDDTVTFMDLMTYETLTVVRADCGLGCKCALEVVA